MLSFIENNVIFGVLFSLGAFLVGMKINKKFQHPALNPLLISVVLIIGMLKATGIRYDVYKEQTKVLSMLLGPATVALAVPLYKNIAILKTNFKAILIGIATGSVASIVSVVGLGWFLGAKDQILFSMAPKAVTTPIAMEVSRMLGGIPALTAGLVAITGIFGACFAPEILRLFKIKNPVAKGIAIGTTTHALGTTRAFQEGEVEGAMSSLSIGIAGIITALIAPYILQYLQ